MRNDHYPAGTVQALLLTDLITANTRKVLKDRLEEKYISAPVFFDDHLFVTLCAICNRLIPQTDSNRFVNLAGSLDSFLANGKGNGWRYDTMPPDTRTFTKGLQGVNETSVFKFNKDFQLLDSSQQDEVLTEIQTGKPSGSIWERIAAGLFFEELLATIAEMYYSHPFAKEDIGEVAFADAKGWQKTRLNELEDREPQTVKK